MNKFYLVVVLLFMSGHIMAQNTRSTSRIKQESNSKSMGNAQTNTTINVELTDYPLYINTGDKKLDDANYEVAKFKWIRENHNGPLSMKITSEEGKKSWDFENMAGFPKYINTGNVETDKTMYNAAIKTWFENNPTEYKKLKGIK